MADVLSSLIAGALGLGGSAIGVLTTARNQASRIAALEGAREKHVEKLAAAEAAESDLREKLGALRTELAEVRRERGLSSEDVRRLIRDEMTRELAAVQAEVRDLRAAAARGVDKHHEVERLLDRVMGKLEALT
jgi:chromosome segregation ATPase